MFKNKTLIIIISVAIALAIGIAAGVFIYSKNSGEPKVKEIESFTSECSDLYGNIKDSKKILKLNIVIETTDAKLKDTLDAKIFLVRDKANEIIVTKTEEELREEKGQTILKQEIKRDLMEIFETEKITNIYFNDFIIQ